MNLLKFLYRDESIKRTIGTTHPLKSNTFWGIVISIVCPLLSQALGIDVTTLIDAVKAIKSASTSTNFDYWQILQIISQLIGIALMIRGTLNKNRKPLSIG